MTRASRTRDVRIRLSDEEFEQFSRVARQHNLSVSSLLRMLVHHNDERAQQVMGQHLKKMAKPVDARTKSLRLRNSSHE